MITFLIKDIPQIPEAGKKLDCPYCHTLLTSVMCSTSLTPSGMIVKRESHWRHLERTECFEYTLNKRKISQSRDTTGESKSIPEHEFIDPACVFADGFELYVIHNKKELCNIVDDKNKMWVIDIDKVDDIVELLSKKGRSFYTHRLMKDSCYLKAQKVWLMSTSKDVVYHIRETHDSSFGSGLQFTKAELWVKLTNRHGGRNNMANPTHYYECNKCGVIYYNYYPIDDSCIKCNTGLIHIITDLRVVEHLDNLASTKENN